MPRTHSQIEFNAFCRCVFALAKFCRHTLDGASHIAELREFNRVMQGIGKMSYLTYSDRIDLELIASRIHDLYNKVQRVNAGDIICEGE